MIGFDRTGQRRELLLQSSGTPDLENASPVARKRNSEGLPSEFLGEELANIVI
jgi:hypothetical protein